MDWETLYCPNQHCRYYGIGFPTAGLCGMAPIGVSHKACVKLAIGVFPCATEQLISV